jgi:hypothetical protein
MVLRLNATRPWISRSGPRAQRQTTLVFRLSRPAIVELVVTRIAPDCRLVGKFRVAGRAGLNRVRFRGRIGRRVLRAGTYRVTARTLRSRGAPVKTRLVIVGQPNPQPGEIAVARASNTCAAVNRTESSAAAVSAGPGAGTDSPSSGGDSESTLARAGGVLGVQFTKAVELAQKVPPFVFILLGLAIALLGLAAIPRQAAPNLRVQALLAYHRELIALGGTITLIGAALTYVVW